MRRQLLRQEINSAMFRYYKINSSRVTSWRNKDIENLKLIINQDKPVANLLVDLDAYLENKLLTGWLVFGYCVIATGRSSLKHQIRLGIAKFYGAIESASAEEKSSCIMSTIAEQRQASILLYKKLLADANHKLVAYQQVMNVAQSADYCSRSLELVTETNRQQKLVRQWRLCAETLLKLILNNMPVAVPSLCLSSLNVLLKPVLAEMIDYIDDQQYQILSFIARHNIDNTLSKDAELMAPYRHYKRVARNIVKYTNQQIQKSLSLATVSTMLESAWYYFSHYLQWCNSLSADTADCYLHEATQLVRFALSCFYFTKTDCEQACRWYDRMMSLPLAVRQAPEVKLWLDQVNKRVVYFASEAVYGHLTQDKFKYDAGFCHQDYDWLALQQDCYFKIFLRIADDDPSMSQFKHRFASVKVIESLQIARLCLYRNCYYGLTIQHIVTRRLLDGYFNQQSCSDSITLPDLSILQQRLLRYFLQSYQQLLSFQAYQACWYSRYCAFKSALVVDKQFSQIAFTAAVNHFFAKIHHHSLRQLDHRFSDQSWSRMSHQFIEVLKAAHQFDITILWPQIKTQLRCNWSMLIIQLGQVMQLQSASVTNHNSVYSAICAVLIPLNIIRKLATDGASGSFYQSGLALLQESKVATPNCEDKHQQSLGYRLLQAICSHHDSLWSVFRRKPVEYGLAKQQLQQFSSS